MKRAAESRRRDLLVYVALANLRKKVPFGHLVAQPALRADIASVLRQLHEGPGEGHGTALRSRRPWRDRVGL
jgi:hypothetical protein